MTDEKPNECKFCGGIAREPTAGERFIGALLTTTQNITMNQLAEIAARLGLKLRLVITEMTDDERKDAAEKLAVK